MKTMKRVFVCAAVALLVASTPLVTIAADAAEPEPGPNGELRPAAVIGSHMVLQRDMPLPVWGWAEAGEAVTVTIAGNQAKAIADAEGSWKVKLPAMKAGGPHVMTISGRKKTLTLENVMVGEVWLCSGQSNMKWPLQSALNSREEIKAADYPSIRMLNVHSRAENFPVREFRPNKPDAPETRWAPCSPEVAKTFSAVGYFFGRELHRELEVPIGLIGSYWNNSAIHWWTPAEGIKSVPELKRTWDLLARWAVRKEADPPRFFGTTKFYNGMIHPLVPFAIRGVIWYQGEHGHKEGEIYFHKMRALIQGWRGVWDQGEFPFYYVQLPNYIIPRKPPSTAPAAGTGYTIQREMQKKALTIPNTGMAVTIDVGGWGGHPRNKQDVGRRLALWPLAKVYGKNIVCSGPLYKGHKIEGSKVRISFDHVGGGLMVGTKGDGLAPVEEVSGGKLGQFCIAGADQKWHWADAVIDGQSVVVSCQDVPKPLAVRYAWDSDPKGANLYNREGLPASPFRTDDWEIKYAR